MFHVQRAPREMPVSLSARALAWGVYRSSYNARQCSAKLLEHKFEGRRGVSVCWPGQSLDAVQSWKLPYRV